MSFEFCVVDVETTGLFAGGHDRIVEIGLVRADSSGHALDTWHSVVNPERDVGDTALHGISARLANRAPTFRELVGDILSFLAGRRFVAHNARFDSSFIAMEMARAGIEARSFETLCTMSSSARIGLGRSLQDCCRNASIENHAPHTAIGDAMATAELLEYLLAYSVKASGGGVSMTLPAPLEVAGAFKPECRAVTRDEAVSMSRPRPYLSRIAGKLPAVSSDSRVGSDAATAYAEMLDRVLEDRAVSEREARALADLAASWELGPSQVHQVHETYFKGLARLAMADGEISDSELAELEILADLMGLPRMGRQGLESFAVGEEAVAIPGTGAEFDGMSVCFTGASACSVQGAPLTRELATEVATACGLAVVKSVTKSLDLLVVSDAETQSGKAKKARKYGVRIIAERSFWPRVGVVVD